MAIRDEDMIGKEFGRWVVLDRAEKKVGNRSYWVCECKCGTVRDVSSGNLRGGTSQSCGCLRREEVAKSAKKLSTKHGMHGTRFYTIWQNMKSRCNNPNYHGFHYYGGRGIKIHPTWSEFENFKSDLYELYTKHAEVYGEDNTTIERVDVNNNYEPGNVRFATKTEQILNRRIARNNKSGYEGVNYSQNMGKWEARISLFGKKKHLGFFTELEEAINARKEAESLRDEELKQHLQGKREVI